MPIWKWLENLIRSTDMEQYIISDHLQGQELETLRDEHRRAEDARLEREENLWLSHEHHLSELDAARRSFTELQRKHELDRSRAELELERERNSFEEHRARSEQHLASRLRHLEELERLGSVRPHSCELAVQTMPDLGELAVQTESQLNIAIGGVSVGTESESQVDGDGLGGLTDREFFRMTLEEQKSWLRDQEEVLRKERRLMEVRLAEKERSVEEMFLTGSEKMELERRRLEEKEKDFRQKDKVMLDSMAEQSEIVAKIEHREKQLMLYMEEKRKEMMPDYERAAPLGASYSEDSIPGSRGYPRQSKSSSEASGRASADSLSVRLGGSPVPPTTKAGARPKIMSGGRSTEGSPRTSSQPKMGTKFRTSATAQQVTDRLYNAEKIRQGAPQIMSGAKRKEGSSSVPRSAHNYGPKEAMYTRSQSEPSLEDPALLMKRSSMDGSGSGGGRGRKMRSPSPRLKLSNTSLASVPESTDEPGELSTGSSAGRGRGRARKHSRTSSAQEVPKPRKTNTHAQSGAFAADDGDYDMSSLSTSCPERPPTQWPEVMTGTEVHVAMQQDDCYENTSDESASGGSRSNETHPLTAKNLSKSFNNTFSPSSTSSSVEEGPSSKPKKAKLKSHHASSEEELSQGAIPDGEDEEVCLESRRHTPDGLSAPGSQESKVNVEFEKAVFYVDDIPFADADEDVVMSDVASTVNAICVLEGSPSLTSKVAEGPVSTTSSSTTFPSHGMAGSSPKTSRPSSAGIVKKAQAESKPKTRSVSRESLDSRGSRGSSMEKASSVKHSRSTSRESVDSTKTSARSSMERLSSSSKPARSTSRDSSRASSVDTESASSRGSSVGSRASGVTEMSSSLDRDLQKKATKKKKKTSKDGMETDENNEEKKKLGVKRTHSKTKADLKKDKSSVLSKPKKKKVPTATLR